MLFSLDAVVFFIFFLRRLDVAQAKTTFNFNYERGAQAFDLLDFLLKNRGKNKIRTVEFAFHDNESAHSEFVLDSNTYCNETRLGKEQTFFVIAFYPMLMLSFLFTPAFTVDRLTKSHTKAKL